VSRDLRRRYVVNTSLFWLPIGLGVAPAVLMCAAFLLVGLR